MTQNFTEILNRVKKILSTDKDQDVANAINVSINAFSNRKRSNSIPYSEFVQLAQKKNVSLNWLFHGIGPIYKGKELENEEPGVDSDPLDPPSQNDNLIIIEHQDIIRRFKDPARGLKINQKLIEILETSEDVFDNVESFINGAHQAVRSMKKASKKIQNNG